MKGMVSFFFATAVVFFAVHAEAQSNTFFVGPDDALIFNVQYDPSTGQPICPRMIRIGIPEDDFQVRGRRQVMQAQFNMALGPCSPRDESGNQRPYPTTQIDLFADTRFGSDEPADPPSGNDPVEGGGGEFTNEFYGGGWGLDFVLFYSLTNGIFVGGGPSYSWLIEEWMLRASLLFGMANPSGGVWADMEIYEPFKGSAPGTGAMLQWGYNGWRGADGSGWMPFLHGTANANLGEFTGFHSFDLVFGPGIEYWVEDDFAIGADAGCGYSQYAEHGDFGCQIGVVTAIEFD